MINSKRKQNDEPQQSNNINDPDPKQSDYKKYKCILCYDFPLLNGELQRTQHTNGSKHQNMIAMLKHATDNKILEAFTAAGLPHLKTTKKYECDVCEGTDEFKRARDLDEHRGGLNHLQQVDKFLRSFRKRCKRKGWAPGDVLVDGKKQTYESEDIHSSDDGD